MAQENNVLSFEEFCEKYAKEMNNIRKYNIAYGSKLNNPIRSDLILFVASNLNASNELTNVIQETVSHKKGHKVVAIAEQESDVEALHNIVETHPFRTEKSHEYLATAKTIVTDSILPFWFVKREDQTVIYLCSQNTLAQENRLDRIHFSTALLKASKIVVNTQSDLEKLQELYGIKDVFYKPILETSSLEEKINIILGHAYNAEEIIPKKEKETVAIYVKWDESPLTLPYLDFLTSQMDPARFDITMILCRKLKDDISTLQIENLNPNVRILQREGVYTGTIEDYRKTQYLVRNMLHCEDIYDKYQSLNADFLECERKRIWGDLSFDYVIGFGDIKPIWLSLLDIKTAKGRFYVETTPEDQYLFIPAEDQSKESLAYFNQRKLYNIIFDKILFSNPRLIPSGVKKMKLDQEKVCGFSFSANISKDVLKPLELKTAKYRGQEYFVTQQRYLTPNKSFVNIIPVPSEHSFITDVRNQDLETLLSRFSSLYQNGEFLYIYGKPWAMIEALATTYDLTDRIFSLEDYNWRFEELGQFYQKLQGYVTTESCEKANAIRTLTEQFGLPSFELTEDSIQTLDQEFSDISEYKQFVKTELDDLFQ